METDIVWEKSIDGIVHLDLMQFVLSFPQYIWVKVPYVLGEVIFFAFMNFLEKFPSLIKFQYFKCA